MMQLFYVYNSTHRPEVGFSPYFLFHGRTYERRIIPDISADHISGVPNLRLSPADRQIELQRHYAMALSTVRNRLKVQHKAHEVRMALADVAPHFDIGSHVMVHLGDSNGGISTKVRCHAGPFKVTTRIDSCTYKISGEDGIEIAVSGRKLLDYKPSLADMLGTNSLAASAVGAAEARLLSYNVRARSNVTFQNEVDGIDDQALDEDLAIC